MKEALLILFGWVLGLVGPNTVEAIKSYVRRRKVEAALRTELEDLQYRLAISSLSLLQRHGKLDKKFLLWVKPIIESYSGYEPSQAIRELLNRMIQASDEGLAQLSHFFRAKENMASNVKTVHAEFLEAHLAEISEMPISLQRKIHEFRSHIGILNQEISAIDARVLMTFTSISAENLERLKADSFPTHPTALQVYGRQNPSSFEGIA
jgi:hypothetical protein